MKAAFTHQAFHGGSDCLQVLGGHGYVREWGIEQVVRDARVAMIYEGTNEIQAIDLLVRKIMADGGLGLNQLLDDMKAETNSETAEAGQLNEQHLGSRSARPEFGSSRCRRLLARIGFGFVAMGLAAH
jgi:hypothetical protein